MLDVLTIKLCLLSKPGTPVSFGAKPVETFGKDSAFLRKSMHRAAKYRATRLRRRQKIANPDILRIFVFRKNVRRLWMKNTW